MIKLSKLVLAGGLALSMTAGVAGLSAAQAATPASAASEAKQVKVIYHINDSETQALGGLRNMRNHLDVAPKTKIVVVAHSDGIDFLSNDYKDAATVAPLVAGLAARGVTFEVCEITLGRKNMTKDDFMLEANFTPSGVARIGELQALEGYAYLKP